MRTFKLILSTAMCLVLSTSCMEKFADQNSVEVTKESKLPEIFEKRNQLLGRLHYRNILRDREEAALELYYLELDETEEQPIRHEIIDGNDNLFVTITIRNDKSIKTKASNRLSDYAITAISNFKDKKLDLEKTIASSLEKEIRQAAALKLIILEFEFVEKHMSNC